MLKVTAATHDLAVANAASPSAPEAAPLPATEPTGPDEVDWSTVEVTLTEAQTRQFVTLYQALQDFDDRAAQARLRCPRLCLVGSADEIAYDERWGGVQVSLADPVIRHRAELQTLGWEVHVLDGLDHMQAMQATQVLPILRPWLLGNLGPGS
jgi:glutaredoxin-related protein